MITTVLNTTLLFLFAAFVGCLARFARAGERDAGDWMRNFLGRVSHSKLVRAALIAGCAVGMGSRILVGYLGPGDLFQDFVGAKEFAAGRGMNPTDTMPERVQYWLGQNPIEPP